MTPLVQAFVNDRLGAGAGWQGTLYLNASCPFVRELANKPPHTPVWSGTLRLLYQMARLFAGRLMRPAEAAEAFPEFTQALNEMHP